LHNLYGPAYIKYSTTSECYTNSFAVYKFYIDGKLVYDSINDINKGCNKIEWFKTKEIFFYKKLNNYSDIDIIPSNYHRKKEGIDYEKTIINLNDRIKNDKRRLKLIALNDRQKKI
jgi:hypothetical protein